MTWKARLESPRQKAIVPFMAALIALPSLGAGLAIDDFWHRLILLRFPYGGWQVPSPLFMFSAADGDPAHGRFAIEHGLGAWWSSLDVQIKLLRPLSAATHLLDYALWPNAPWLMHVQSILWFVGCVALGRLVYLRVLGAGWVAELASILFAIDWTHGMSVGWIAQRNTLVTTFFGLAALLFHDRDRRDGDRRAAIASPILLALALAAGEGALAIAAFLAAHALTLDDAPIARRAKAFAPHAIVVALWAVIYRAFGFGVRGSGMYVDPVASPLRYLRGLVLRAPTAIATELGGPPCDLWVVFDSKLGIGLLLAGAFVALVLTALALAPLRSNKEARFFALGTVLASIPICATLPASRILLPLSFGAMGLLAMLVRAIGDGLVRSKLLRGWSYAVLATHLVLAPPLFVLISLQGRTFQRITERLAASLPRDPSITRYVLVNPPNCTFVALPPIVATLQGAHVAERAIGLAVGTRPMEIERLDDRTLRIRAPGGFSQSVLDQLGRDPEVPMPVGTRVELDDLTILVTATTPEGQPEEARFRFATPLEDPTRAFLRWNGDALVPYSLPPIGETTAVPPHAMRL